MLGKAKVMNMVEEAEGSAVGGSRHSGRRRCCPLHEALTGGSCDEVKDAVVARRHLMLLVAS